jgi:hypothetical protein
MLHARALFLALLVCAVAALAACGGDDSDGDDFVAEANAICTDSARERTATQQSPPTNAEEALAQNKQQQRIRRQAQADLKALEPSEEAADAYDEFLAKRQRVIEVVVGEEDLLRAEVSPDDPRYVEFLTELDRASDAAQAAAEEAGLAACAGVLAPDERDRIVAIVREFETTPVEDCRQFLTEDAIDSLFGGLAECQRVQENPPPQGFTKRIEVESARGIAGVGASVRASLVGGPGDGQDIEYVLEYQNGTYKIATVFQQTPE